MPPTAKPTPKAAIWIMLVTGPFLLLMAAGLAVLLYVVLPTPSRPLPAWVPFLLLDVAILGAIGFANGLYTRRTGQQHPILRGLTLAGGAVFLVVVFASLR